MEFLAEQLKSMPEEAFQALLTMLEVIPFPFCARHKVEKARRMSFGFIWNRMANTFCNSKKNTDHPELWRMLQELCASIAPDKSFNAVQVNKDYTCQSHMDKNNDGESIVVSFGPYVGGELVVDGVLFQAKHRPVMFDGSHLSHHNLSHDGRKYSVVFYNTGRKRGIPYEARDDLRDKFYAETVAKKRRLATQNITKNATLAL